MEVECVKRLWGRSVEKLKLGYKTILCDGDSKAFDAIASSVVYGKVDYVLRSINNDSALFFRRLAATRAEN